MEQMLHQNGMPIPKSVRAKQTVAAVLLMLPLILSLGIGAFLLGYLGTTSAATIYSAVLTGIRCIAYILLAFIAINKCVKTSMFIFIGLFVFAFFVPNLAIALVGVEDYVLYNKVQVIIYNICDLICAYAYSLILLNSNIKVADKTWICLLMTFCIASILGSDAVFFAEQHWSIWWGNNNSLCYFVWNILYTILFIIATFRLVRCGAFNGTNTNINEQPQTNYSPINKFVFAVVIGCMVGVVLLTIIYGNVDAINKLASNF